MSTDKCSHCGASEIVEGIKVRLTADAGSVGLQCKAGLGMWGAEPLLADLCSKCGTVVRLHVRSVERKWLTE